MRGKKSFVCGKRKGSKFPHKNLMKTTKPHNKAQFLVLWKNYREGLKGSERKLPALLLLVRKTFFLPNIKEIEAQEERIDLFH